ncbi:MAG: T9SS type A sorting domain-containing protein [Chitinophagales bacterium]
MKKIYLFLISLIIASVSYSQSTWEMAYEVIQTNCSGCHIAGHESGLDLSGTIGEVYDNLFDIAPTNPVSAAKGYKRVYPGDPYKSFIFDKINNNLALDVTLEAGEGLACPQGAYPLNNKDIELIRQWIIYGAFESDTLVDIDLINDFYDNAGIQSVPSPPAPPAPGEGYQVHFGPFFLWPETEHEYWQRFDLNIPETVEVNRIETFMGEYSHHFITYRYNTPAIGATADRGLHDLAAIDVFNTTLVSANQYSTTLELPAGTAFTWEANTVLDLNSHYLNYSLGKSEACEVYLNIYTQPVGTAIEEMIPVLISDDGFYIPNNGLPYSHTGIALDGTADEEEEIFFWAITSHTHKHASDFDIYERNEDGTQGEHLFDASCGATEGIPGCLDEIYDYHHPPVRYWPSMKALRPRYGIIYETEWINNEDHPLQFGLTNNDEMQVLIYFYVEDTTGLNLPLAVSDVLLYTEQIKIFPNPASDIIYINSAVDLSSSMISIADLSGRVIKLTTPSGSASKYYPIAIDGLSPGVYLISIINESGILKSEKIVLQ